MSDINVKVLSDNHTHKGALVAVGTVLTVDPSTAAFMEATGAGEVVKPKEDRATFGKKYSEPTKEN